MLIDGSCIPVQVNLYEAFGSVEKTWGNSENNRLGNTKEFDAAIGLYNHGFRYFDAVIGRYISNAPIAYEGGFNLYVYCTNDPVNKFDPHGLFEWGVFFKEFGNNVLTGAAKWGDNARAGCAMYGKDFTGMVGTGGKQMWDDNQKNLNERYSKVAEKDGFGGALKRAAADITGVTNGQRAINGVDPVTQQKLTPQERMESGGTAVAQGAGWAAGGVGIVRGVAGGTVATAEAGSGAVAGGEGTAAATTTVVRTAARDVNAALKAKQAQIGAKTDEVSAKIIEGDGGYVAPEGKVPTCPAPSSTPIDPEIKPLDVNGDAPNAAAPAKRDTGVTVLGKYPNYVNLANSMDARYFQIPPLVWDKMTPAERWAANQKFLDRTVKRGDDVVASDDPNAATGTYKKEVEYLKEKKKIQYKKQEKKKMINNVVYKIVSAPLEIIQRNVSIRDYLNDYVNIIDTITIHDIAAALISNNTLVNAWCEYSEDKRVNKGWYIQEESPLMYCVGCLGESAIPQEHYSNKIEACSHYVAHELRSIIGNTQSQ